MKRLHFATMTFPLPERKAGDGCGYVMEAIVLLLTAVAAHFLTELHVCAAQFKRTSYMTYDKTTLE
eukprot:scaffold176214_cov19-Tisochrysis_lutea.AAC.1